ncbi:MAG: hypothetical protein H0T79_09490 [Deltaproteobacteria bacterium]|nr:hypothetical protein [Deltaproteobacteria bacterium]
MSLDLRKEKGVPLDQQVFTLREFGGPPFSKLDDDAFTRVRVILMNGVEAEAIRFSHACARMNRDLRVHLARVRRIDHHQQTVVNWLNPADQSPLETTIGYEQTAIEVTAWVAQHEPDPYLAQMYRFGMLEDFDHLYRFSGLMDRLTGQDSNNILQSYTDVRPGRPTIFEHRAPEDDVRDPYDRATALPITKLNALTILSAENQVRDYYMNIGPQFADPIARTLYGEIASIEEQHVTHYESLVDPDETWLEKWLMHECTEVYTYWSCLQQESNRRLKQIWDRFLAYELGQLHFVMDLMRQIEKRDPEELVPATLPEPIKYESQRDFVRDVLRDEADLRAAGPFVVPVEDESAATIRYRDQLNSEGSPSELVTTDYQYTPGTELERTASTAIH